MVAAQLFAFFQNTSAKRNFSLFDEKIQKGSDSVSCEAAVDDLLRVFNKRANR
jgi:hypothetical protein